MKKQRDNPNSGWNKRRALNKLVWDAMRAVPCMDCGGRFPAVCMDLDHRPGETKEYEVSMLAQGGSRPSKMLAEAAKCDRVCSNCHRIRTQERLNE